MTKPPPTIPYNPPIPLNAQNILDLAHGGYLPYVEPQDVQPALQTCDDCGETPVHQLARQGFCFSKYPPGTLTLKDLLLKNKNGARPIDIALNQSKTPKEASEILHQALMSLPQKDAEKLLKEAKKNGLGKIQMASKQKNPTPNAIEK